MGNPGNDRRIDNIEFAVSDVARSREFYGKAFGWTYDYELTDCEFSDGRLTGGLAKGTPINPGGPLVILYADNLGEMQRRLENVGAIVKPVFAFPAADGFISMTWMDMNSPYGPTSRRSH